MWIEYRKINLDEIKMENLNNKDVFVAIDKLVINLYATFEHCGSTVYLGISETEEKRMMVSKECGRVHSKIHADFQPRKRIIYNHSSNIHKHSHSILAGPLTSTGFILCPIGLVDVSNFWHQGIIWVWVGQQRTDGQQHLRDCQSWGPLIFQNIQADGTVGVNVWVVDSSGEVDLGWLEWVIGREMDIQEVHSSSVR